MGTIITAVALLLALVLIIRKMVRDKKNGKSMQCGGNCGGCDRHCGL